jgi:hypothetical protein
MKEAEEAIEAANNAVKKTEALMKTLMDDDQTDDALAIGEIWKVQSTARSTLTDEIERRVLK